jgi:hypothetical protein
VKNDPENAARDGPQTAARRLLAGGEWVSAAWYAEQIRDLVTDRQAVWCFDRLRDAGHKPRPLAEQVAAGRERLAQEALQRLVQRGECEAAGRGSERRYRLVRGAGTGVEMFEARPKVERRWVPLEMLTFDRRLQMRDVRGEGGEPSLHDEAWVERLLELRQEKVELEPLEAVEDASGEHPVLWVFRGFHRGEARRRNGERSVEVLIYPGTFDDALFWSLSENGRQPLPRTDRDCRKAFDRLLDTPSLLGRVYAAAQDEGGVYRALGAAAGLSGGAVHKYLRLRGLSVDRRTKRIVALPTPSLFVEEPAPAPEKAARSDSARAGEIAPVVSRVSPVDMNPELTGAKDALAESVKLLRSLGRLTEDLLKSPAGNYLRNAAAAQAVPFAVVERESKPQSINDYGKAPPVRVETWPTLSVLSAVFAQVQADVIAAELGGET